MRSDVMSAQQPATSRDAARDSERVASEAARTRRAGGDAGRRVDRKAAPLDQEVVRRLDRIEQAIETMAVEVERVSEAQRYSARLLTERLPDGLALRAVAAERTP